jgi:hypothetical protein
LNFNPFYSKKKIDLKSNGEFFGWRLRTDSQMKVGSERFFLSKYVASLA